MKGSCPDCKHDQHEPGKCARCNCGQSEISHLTAPVDVSDLDFSRDRHAATGHLLPVRNRGHRVKRKKTEN